MIVYVKPTHTDLLEIINKLGRAIVLSRLYIKSCGMNDIQLKIIACPLISKDENL